MPDSRWFGRRQTRRGQFRRLGRIILPVVIRDEERSIIVAQLQRWIGQRIRHSDRSQAGTDAAHDDPVIAAAVAQNEAGDHDVVTRADKGARADISQLRGDSLIEVVNFNQGDTRGVVLASNDCRIGSRDQGRIDR